MTAAFYRFADEHPTLSITVHVDNLVAGMAGGERPLNSSALCETSDPPSAA